MGLLDWLTDLGGSDQMGNLTGSGGPGSTVPPPSPPMQPPPPAPSQAMPPVQSMDNAGPSQVQMLGQDAPPLPPGQQGASSGPPPVPLPQPRPAAADTVPPPLDPASIPPNAQLTQGGGQGPLPVAPLARQAAPDPAPQGSLLSRALGLNPSTAKSMMGALGGGLTAAGNSAGKSPFQALASGAGASLEAGQKTDDKTYDQKIKYLQAAVAAKAAGDKSAYNENYSKYLMGKLQNETDKAASPDAGSGKKGAWNKPDSQKFIDAQHAVASDPEIRASQKLLEQTAKTGEPADIAKAQAAHTALIQQKQREYLTGVGLNPQQIQKNAQTPPGTRENPHVITSQQDFDHYVKPGDAYVNPKDGKVYIRKGGGKSGDSESPSASPASPAPASPGSPPEPPGPAPGIKTDDDED